MIHGAAVPDSDLSPVQLTHLFSARLEFASDSPSEAIVPAEGRDGAHIGTGVARRFNECARVTVAPKPVAPVHNSDPFRSRRDKVT